MTRASAVWAWNDARQRTLVTVYVGDDSGAATSARQALAAAGDPNRPVRRDAGDANRGRAHASPCW